jgi:hypothetical protein
LPKERRVGSRPRMFDTADPGGEKPCVCGHLTLLGLKLVEIFLMHSNLK